MQQPVARNCDGLDATTWTGIQKSGLPCERHGIGVAVSTCNLSESGAPDSWTFERDDVVDSHRGYELLLERDIRSRAPAAAEVGRVDRGVRAYLDEPDAIDARRESVEP
jgi:hypothetical protein